MPPTVRLPSSWLGVVVAICVGLLVSCSADARPTVVRPGVTPVATSPAAATAPSSPTTPSQSPTTTADRPTTSATGTPGTAPAGPGSTVAASTTTTTEALSATALTAPLGRSPAALGAQLATAWPTALDARIPADDRAAAGRLVQLVYRRLAARPEWVPMVLDALEPRVRAIADNDLTAALAPSRSPSPAGPPQTTLPAWTIRDPKPATELVAYYHEAEAQTGVPWTVLAAINLVETRMGRIVGVSSAGAVGPMQFLPSTWAACCAGEPTDDHDAIIGAATYLVRRGALTDIRQAIHGYNPNDAYVEMVMRYSANLAAEPETYAAYHAWQVFVRTTAGSIRLPVGYAASDPVDAATYLASHPQDAA